MSRTKHRRISVTVAVALLCALSCGCSSVQKWNPYAGKPVDVLGPGATKEEVVALVNRSASRMTGWRSTDVKVKAKGVPISLSANMAVESPRGFRMVAESIRGYEADFGSNDERLWFWIRSAPYKHVFTCKHEEMNGIQDRMPVPFRADWMMEVLGVVPLDPEGVQLETDPGDPKLLQLLSHVELNDGRTAVRMVTVDSRTGRVVAHQLWRPEGDLIAQAFLNDYRPDDETGLELPRHIRIEWPEADTDMTLKIGEIEVNPTSVPESTWSLPKMADYPEFDLAAGQMPVVR
ncbi:hypothetical protein [Stratiformator vulcanicus]|uniref:Outer membrane lipoprotein-sorting protein n=1 Tax=Stratiformator vulcanicus TaxID=2527980 RepID=A0A517R095_9PLAN|nr:hypothetical protein [Stratiformator vulcanicus]QDT37244.1 hypothetical protein Pan189_16170 [Stratiformator vulcanicus]